MIREAYTLQTSLVLYMVQLATERHILKERENTVVVNSLFYRAQQQADNGNKHIESIFGHMCSTDKFRSDTENRTWLSKKSRMKRYL